MRTKTKHKKRHTVRKKRKVRKLRFAIIALLFLTLIGFLTLKLTENGEFTVIDVSQKEAIEQGTYKHFWFAQLKMNSLDSDHAYIQRQDQKVVAITSGLVDLNTKETTENTLYTIDGIKEQGYTNGNYGGDALYLDTSMDGSQVLMQISGAKGWVSVEDIQLYLFTDDLYLSTYTVQNDSLIHTISTDLLQGSLNPLAIGKAPEFLKEDTSYYSYDGNYFYTDFDQMTDDVRNNEHEHAVNKEAYFNFYQYVPHRSLTQLTSYNYQDYLHKMGITQKASSYPCTDNESALYDLGPTFFEVQNQTGVNASMMFAVALNESAYGRSEYALTNYNLFGHAAYDENPDSATTYTSYQDCIYQHAYGFIQNGYANPNDERYHGSWFGNKGSGINVQYASDPYWGEKAAHFYYQLDKQNNYVDYNTIHLQTKITQGEFSVYASKDTKDPLYTYAPFSIVSFVIENEEENGNETWYTVNSESPVIDQKIDVSADYRSSVGYIKANDLK